jgi:membrane protein
MGIKSFAKKLISSYSKCEVPQLSAALSYYAIFSLSPLIVIVVAVSSAMLGEDVVAGALLDEIERLVGSEGAQVIETLMENASRPELRTASSIASIIALAIGATGVFAHLRFSLNKIYSVKREAGIFKTIKNRLGSFAIVLSLGFLLLVSLVISAALSAIARYATELFPVSPFLIRLANEILSVIVIALLLAVLYKIIPAAKLKWKDVLPGAILASVLFSAGRYLIGLYLGQSSIDSVYGAAGSVIILLIWVYYSSQILFIGAVFNRIR